MQAIRQADDTDVAAKQHVDLALVPNHNNDVSAEQARAEAEKLVRNGRIARYLTVFLTLALLILWPMPMYGTGYVFSEKFFTGWIVVGILWLFVSAGIVGVYPVFEGRKTIWKVCKALVGQGVRARSPAMEGEQWSRATSGGVSVVEGEEVVEQEGEKGRMSTRTLRKEKS